MLALRARRTAARPSATCRCPTRPASRRPRARGVVHVASTRNPNQVFDLVPGDRALRGRATAHARPARPSGRSCRCARASCPGCLYLHDLALDRRAAARQRRRAERGRAPRRRRRLRAASGGRACIERLGRPAPSRANYLQLNSIAAGADARAARSSPRRRDAIVDAPARAPQLPGRRPRRDLLRRDARAGRPRPHAPALGASARAGGSGSTTAATARSGWSRTARFQRVARASRLDARPRASHGDVAFVGTSRVLPRFRQYAPGLDLATQRLRRPRARHADAAGCWAASSGRTATRSSPSRRFRRCGDGLSLPPAGARRVDERAGPLLSPCSSHEPQSRGGRAQP